MVNVSRSNLSASSIRACEPVAVSSSGRFQLVPTLTEDHFLDGLVRLHAPPSLAIRGGSDSLTKSHLFKDPMDIRTRLRLPELSSIGDDNDFCCVGLESRQCGLASRVKSLTVSKVVSLLTTLSLRSSSETATVSVRRR